MTFRSDIIRWRELRGLKQKDLAKKLGITTQALSNFERGKAPFPAGRVRRLARALDMEIDLMIMGIVDDYEMRLRKKAGL